MRKALLLAVLALPAPAQTLERLFIATSAADALSSLGMRETNPVLGRGSFGWSQVGRKVGIDAGVFLAERKLSTRHPKAARVVLIVGIAGATFATGNNLVVRWRAR